MTTTPLERRQSLFFNEYEKVHPDPSHLNSMGTVLKKDTTKKLLEKKNIGIDDMDMISLHTSFDKQMFQGSPMYLDPEEDTKINPITLQKSNLDNGKMEIRKGHSIKPVPSGSSHFHLQKYNKGNNPFNELVEWRSKYIVGSYQDNKSNIKYNNDKWLVYPKPLPKFWKFEKDERFIQDESEYDLSNPSKKIKNGYYYPHPFDEEYEDERKHKIHYTGESFDMDHYQTKLKHYRKINKLDQEKETTRYIPSFAEFRQNTEFIAQMTQDHAIGEIAEKRLGYLLDKFELFQHLKSKSEILENKQVPYRDFYNSRKIDQDLLLSGVVSQRQLSEFIWDKINYEPDKIVYITSKGENLTIRDFFQPKDSETSSQLLNIGLKLIDDDFLEWYRDIYLVTYHIVDIPAKTIEENLVGKRFCYYLLAKTFLEFDNHIDGQYLAELLIKYVIHFLEKSKYQLSQISIDFQFRNAQNDDYGTNNWWLKFSDWLMRWKLVSYNIRWNVRISRIYSKLFNYHMIDNFQEYVDCIFHPLLKNQNNENLQYCLTTVCSLDIVISQADEYLWSDFLDVETSPEEWKNTADNPTISQYIYHIFVNLAKFNETRFNSNKNTLVLRSYCSPTVSTRTSQFSSDSVYFSEKMESLICNLLICNGGLLQAEPIWTAPSLLEYLFYLFQIPMIIAPLSSVSLHHGSSQNNSKERSNLPLEVLQRNQYGIKPSRDITASQPYSYNSNPFMNLMKIGFKIAISSKSVIFNSSYTLEPIIEEYSVAASIYLLNAADLCELARNSVISSGYDGYYKAHWSGIVSFEMDGSPMSETLGLVDIWYDKPEDTRIKHNVPFIRRNYRNETLEQEWSFVNEYFV